MTGRSQINTRACEISHLFSQKQIYESATALTMYQNKRTGLARRLLPSRLSRPIRVFLLLTSPGDESSPAFAHTDKARRDRIAFMGAG